MRTQEEVKERLFSIVERATSKEIVIRGWTLHCPCCDSLIAKVTVKRCNCGQRLCKPSKR